MVTCLASPVAIFLTNSFSNKDILNTMAWISDTLTVLEMIFLDTRTAIIGEVAPRAGLRASEQNFQCWDGGGEEKVELVGIYEHFIDGHSGFELF